MSTKIYGFMVKNLKYKNPEKQENSINEVTFFNVTKNHDFQSSGEF